MLYYDATYAASSGAAGTWTADEDYSAYKRQPCPIAVRALLAFADLKCRCAILRVCTVAATNQNYMFTYYFHMCFPGRKAFA